MKLPEKNDPARGWIFVEKLLAEQAAERIEKLSDVELDEELRHAGYDPADLPTADEMLARATAREVARDRARAEAREKARVALAQRRRTRWVITLAAAMFGLLIVLIVKEGPAIVAFWHRGDGEILPDNSTVPPPTPHQQAEALRDEAIRACEAARWTLCRDKLDEAQTLDPAGDSAKRVQMARGDIREGLNHDGGDFKKR